MRQLLADIKAHLNTNSQGLKAEVSAKPDNTGTQPYWVVSRASTQLTGSIELGDLDTDLGSLIQIKSIGSSAVQAMAAHDAAETLIKSLTATGRTVMLIVTEQTNGPMREDATAPEPADYWCDLLVRIWTTPTS